MAKKSKITWTYYIIELAVVFIGVTAGFILNNWREDAAEIKMERKYLESFHSEVLLDKDNLDSLILHSQLKIDNLLNIIKQTEVINKPLTEELAQKIVMEIMYIEWLSPANDTYEDIINSGNLNIVSDYNLKEKISSYYTFLNEVSNVEQFYREHMNNYGFPILYKNYHLLRREFINAESYKSLEFTNMYLGVVALLQQNNEKYKEALEKNEELQIELKHALNLSD
jgi:hypothetical protein